MNCCRQTLHETPCQDTLDQVGSVLRDIVHQLRHLCYACVFDEATDVVGHQQRFPIASNSDVSAASARIDEASVHALISVLRRAGTVSSLLGDDSTPASLLLSASNGLVYYFTRLTPRHGLVLVLAENPVDVTDTTSAFLEGRLRATLNRLATHFAPA